MRAAGHPARISLVEFVPRRAPEGALLRRNTPYAITIAEEAAARQGLAHLLPCFADASQRLQLQEAKLKMENCRRDNPTLAGICHFSAADGNPSPQGVITEFYERKLVDAAGWRQTNGDTVLLAGLEADNRALVGGETFHCPLSVSDFAHPPFTNPRVSWTLHGEDDCTIAEGALAFTHEPLPHLPGRRDHGGAPGSDGAAGVDTARDIARGNACGG